LLLKNFDVFADDMARSLHAGKLTRICVDIRRYEERYFFHGRGEDFSKVIDCLAKAQKTAPRIIEGLKITPDSQYIYDLLGVLAEYKKNFEQIERDCTNGNDFNMCSQKKKVRAIGERLIALTDELVFFEQEKMIVFIKTFKGQLITAIISLVGLSLFIIILLYTEIIKPLKLVENTAIDIANGTFAQLPVDEKKGEIRSILRAFNKMVRELEVQQEQLFQVEKLSSIGTLASGTAHQINNPLNNIATSCQLALSEVDVDQYPMVGRMLETIDRETERAGEIVRGLLEFSRAQIFTLQVYPLSKVVRKVQKLVSCEVPPGISLEGDIPTDIFLYIDVQKTIEALLNLCINAIQAIPEPPGKISIKAVVDDCRKNAVITVTDTGKGIEKEHLQKIFDPFFTTKNAENGTGLGLAVVYGIIKKQHGTTRVESEIGSGTRFTITLPLSQELKKDKRLES